MPALWTFKKHFACEPRAPFISYIWLEGHFQRVSGRYQYAQFKMKNAVMSFCIRRSKHRITLVFGSLNHVNFLLTQCLLTTEGHGIQCWVLVWWRRREDVQRFFLVWKRMTLSSIDIWTSDTLNSSTNVFGTIQIKLPAAIFFGKATSGKVLSLVWSNTKVFSTL